MLLCFHQWSDQVVQSMTTFAIRTTASVRSSDQMREPCCVGSRSSCQCPRATVEAHSVKSRFTRIARSAVSTILFLSVGFDFASPGAHT